VTRRTRRASPSLNLHSAPTTSFPFVSKIASTASETRVAPWHWRAIGFYSRVTGVRGKLQSKRDGDAIRTRPSVRVTAPLLFNSAPLRAWIPRNAVWSSTNSKNEGRRLAAVFVCVACRLTSSLKTDLANCHPDCIFCAIGLSVSVCSPRSYFSVFGLYQLCIARTVSPQPQYHDSDSYHIAPPVTIKRPCC